MKRIIIITSVLIVSFIIGYSKVSAKDNPTLNVLIYGIDSTSNINERSDAILLVNMNFEKEILSVTSIPRDSYVKISCKENKYDKINHAYAYGKEACLNQTVSNLFELDKLYNVMLDFESIEGIVDYFGLIEIEPQFTFCQSDYEFKKKYCFEKGKQISIDGKQALAYMRNRKSLPDGDISRNSNQRHIFKVILQKILNLGLMDKLKFFNYLKSNVSTDLEVKNFNIKKMINMKQIKLNEYTLKGRDYYNKLYYYKLDEKYLEKLKKIYF